MQVIYEDNHLLAVNKCCGEIVQGDRTGDEPLVETLKGYLKEKYAKPGNVFLGVPHRVDRPVSGVVLFARTSKALSRLNELFRRGEVQKNYLALVSPSPTLPKGERRDWLLRNGRQNKSYVCNFGTPDAKEAILRYRTVGHTQRYTLLEIELLTGRHHQIRAQLTAMGCPIKGDLKYGAARSNPDGGICLHAHRIALIHPVSGISLTFEAPFPTDWPKPLCEEIIELKCKDDSNG
ncbi:MAG: RNA pseudouridine synthase [Tannerellaceae bacterium]|jgi:23S rRNA pseudouridine1911/1915/1917 synthase|nr:RNA pseudouridine synthase [Tannerellaceae bacterium]